MPSLSRYMEFGRLVWVLALLIISTEVRDSAVAFVASKSSLFSFSFRSNTIGNASCFTTSTFFQRTTKIFTRAPKNRATWAPPSIPCKTSRVCEIARKSLIRKPKKRAAVWPNYFFFSGIINYLIKPFSAGSHRYRGLNLRPSMDFRIGKSSLLHRKI